MNKILLLLTIGLIPTIAYSQNNKAKKIKKKVTVKKNTPKNGLSDFDLELIKFRQENPIFYRNHTEGLAESGGRTNIDYSNFNGKDCSEIAKKEKWSKWNAPNDADARCTKYLKMKKIKKIMFYPFN